MRRSIFVAILAGTLSFVACSDQPTEAPSRPESPQASPDVGTTPCTLNQLIDLTAKLFPASPRRTAIVLALKSLPQKRQLRLAAAIRRAAFAIIDIFTRAYAAGRLVRSPDTPANLLAFIQGMYCFVGLTPPPTPPGPIDPNEFATAVITQNSGPMNVVTPSQHGGLSFQGLTLPAGVPAVTVFVNKLPDSPGPLFTSLNQYPLFYEFSVFPDVTFTKALIAGVCQADIFPVSNSLRLAHNVGPNFGDVAVLPFVSPTFLNCGTLPPPTGFLGGVRGLFASVFLPAQLHATTSLLITVGTGGNLKHLSPFGSVNPGSNPGSLSIVDQLGNPTSGNVSGEGPVTVYVKASSQNTDPIKGVPVTFDGETTVPTDENGIASFPWDATPGTTLTATVPNELGCPEIPEGATPPYRPRVCFTPSVVTFTTMTLLDYGSGGYRFRLIGSTAPSADTPTYPGGSWFSQSFTPGGTWSTGPAPFGFSAVGCSIYTSHPVATPWAAADGSEADPNTGSGLLLRKEFKTPTAFNGSVLVNVAIDNDIQVYLDGHDVTNAEGVTFTRNPNTDVVNGFWFGYVAPFQAHGGCAQQGDGEFRVPSSHLEPGDQHLLAVYAHDWGGASYVDVRITLDVSD